VRAAAHQADASRLADDLARLDAANAIGDRRQPRDAARSRLLIALFRRAPYRARNLLRWFIVEHGLRARRRRALPRCSTSSSTPRPTRACGFRTTAPRSGFIGGASSCIPPAVAPFLILWRGERELALPHGTLEFAPATAATPLCGARPARGQRPAARGRRAPAARARPPAAGAEEHPAGCRHAAWQRESLPLVFCGRCSRRFPASEWTCASRRPRRGRIRGALASQRRNH
jgi:hypothetical protein